MWVGGRFLFVIVRPRLAADSRVRLRPQVLERYSSLALIAFLLVAFSGILRSFASISRIDELFTTTYGFILLVKIIALLLMGALGAWYRAKLIATQRNGAFWMMVTLELALMGVASGAAAALARSVPPLNEQLAGARDAGAVPQRGRAPAGAHSHPVPDRVGGRPALARRRRAGAWPRTAGVLRLRRRGDTWPIYRTVLWVIGMLLLIWVTSGALNAYGHYLFSAHMLRTCCWRWRFRCCLCPAPPSHSPRARSADAMTARAAAASGSSGSCTIRPPRCSRIRWSPPASSWGRSGCSTSPICSAGRCTTICDQWMVAHFLISGYLFVMSLTGIDPIPYRMPYAGRLVTLIVTMAMHAFFGIAIMSQSGLMVAEWFGAMGRTWGATPMEDQYVGGGIAWSIGEIPTVITAIVVAIQWSRSDEKQQRRIRPPRRPHRRRGARRLQRQAQ